jgi:hypothetical protein
MAIAKKEKKKKAITTGHSQKRKKKGHYHWPFAYCKEYSPNRGLIVISNVGWVFFFFLGGR